MIVTTLSLDPILETLISIKTQASKDIVFNDLFIDWNQDLVLVEGVFDALVAGNAVPILVQPYGRGPTYCSLRNDTPIIALDPDAAAKERRIIEMLHRYDIELYKIDVEGYEDVGSMPKEVFDAERKMHHISTEIIISC